ncbi:1-deoxy-D-xylulose-5-phosphate synthase [Parascardovia denticolens]|uniref:1-deoxy-D-xylulose-5-phosphate synthase n=1 Tax=Parascardovia denticolens TaxID=78258 RepID=UPI00248DEB8E|nr:1-deoxy-D-xylulose-5-phosphate synthase [Parascardovia denticolens]
MYLEKINGPADVKKLDSAQLKALAQEMREAMLARASVHGGHFGPDFGIVEATIALHYVFNSPADKLIFDISHQTYPHKMLTGRKEAYLDPAHYDDVSGFSSPAESPHDFFELGHTSTSISLAVGMAKARDLAAAADGQAGPADNIVALMGDGSLSGGEGLEGLNTAAELKSNFIIVINDNQWSIAENHGGLYRSLAHLRESKGQASDNLFAAMGFDYRYVDEGNDVNALIQAFREVKDIDHPVVVHIRTVKGLGYRPAMEHEEDWHWHGPFDIASGQSPVYSGEDYARLTGEYLMERAAKDPRLLVVASGVPASLGLDARMRAQLGDHYIDVGIAEQTAVAVASGAAKGGAHVVYGTEATFIQRAYDQLFQDLSINQNPATILVFDASFYGMNDITHVGFYDIAMMSNIPGLVMLAPATWEEYKAMLDWSIDQTDHPAIIRVPALAPRHEDPSQVRTDYSQLGKARVISQGEDSPVAVVAMGDFLPLGRQVCQELESKGVAASLIDPVFLSHLDQGLLERIAAKKELTVVLEDGSQEGGFGAKVASALAPSGTKVLSRGFAKRFYDRYRPEDVLAANRLEPGQVVADIMAALA